jgi:hypothetical protein
MTKKTLNKLSHLARMNEDQAIAVIVSLGSETIPKNKAMPLSQIIPTSIWQKLRQGQKGYVGKVFCHLYKELGFEYIAKGKSGTTNFYRLVTDVN